MLEQSTIEKVWYNIATEFESVPWHITDEIAAAYDIISDAVYSKRKIFLCGNGGSAAIANHFVADLSKGAATDTIIRPRVMSLVSDISLITAIANDMSYDDIFSEQIMTWADPGDILIAISSSGNSRNILSAVYLAKVLGCKVLGLSGFDGGELSTAADHSIHVPVRNYGIVEDIHSAVMHAFSQSLRKDYAVHGTDTNSFTF